MRILAIDPGPKTCGVVLYDTGAARVLDADKARSVEDVLSQITRIAASDDPIDLVACERVQSYGISGAHLLQTAEIFGRVFERVGIAGLPFAPLYRREVLRELDLLKASPGPLYGVSSHAWQALGLAVAVASLGLRR